MLGCLTQDTSQPTPLVEKNTSEWGLPDGAIARLGKGMIIDIVLSPDGSQLAVATGFGVWRYDTRTGGLLDVLTGHTDSVGSVAFSPDGSMLASGSEDYTVRIWNAKARRYRQMPLLSDFRMVGHTDAIHSVVFSPDSSALVSGSADKTVRLWDIRTHQEKSRFVGHKDKVTSVVFDLDGKTVASGSEDQTVRLWNVQTRSLKKTFTGHTADVTSVVFSPDGKTLSNGSQDGTILLWNVP